MHNFTDWVSRKINENDGAKIVVNMQDLQNGANSALTERERPWFLGMLNRILRELQEKRQKQSMSANDVGMNAPGYAHQSGGPNPGL